MNKYDRLIGFGHTFSFVRLILSAQLVLIVGYNILSVNNLLSEKNNIVKGLDIIKLVA